MLTLNSMLKAVETFERNSCFAYQVSWLSCNVFSYCPEPVLNCSSNNPSDSYRCCEMLSKKMASKLWQNIVSCLHHFNIYPNSSFSQVAFQRFQSICRKQRRSFCKQQQRSLGITWQHRCCRWSHHLALNEWKLSALRPWGLSQTWDPKRTLSQTGHHQLH